MNFLELQTDVFRRLEESSSSPVFWTLADIKEALNKGYSETSDATEWAEASDTVNITANTTYYDLTSALTRIPLTVTRVFNNQSNRWLEPVDVRDLDREYREWENVYGAPDKYVVRGIYWLGVNAQSATTTGTMAVYYRYLPTALSADADTPGFDQEYHLGLVYYALYDLKCQEREYKVAKKFFGNYLDYEAALKKYVQGRISKDRVASF